MLPASSAMRRHMYPDKHHGSCRLPPAGHRRGASISRHMSRTLGHTVSRNVGGRADHRQTRVAMPPDATHRRRQHGHSSPRPQSTPPQYNPATASSSRLANTHRRRSLPRKTPPPGPQGVPGYVKSNSDKRLRPRRRRLSPTFRDGVTPIRRKPGWWLRGNDPRSPTCWRQIDNLDHH